MTSAEEKKSRLETVKERIKQAAKQAARNEAEITLVAVSKTKPWEDVEAFAQLGVKVFGENYVQEALEKQTAAKSKNISDISWHLIGTLQSNKAKFIPSNFSLFHALDSFSVAEKLDKAAAKAGLFQDCLLEVNVDMETTKGGIAESSLPRVLEQLNALKNIRVTGLMCIPAPSKESRRPFAKLREIRENLNANGAYKGKLTELSMGMSADFEAAILEGATFVRVGSTLFGERESR